jgi:uncharacterized membrane protein YdbT with pleckstrin-like domain
MADEWYVSRGGKRFGPVPAAQLRKLAAAGKIKSSDLLWKDGLNDWVAAESIKGLFPSSAPAGQAIGLAATPEPPAEEETLWSAQPSQLVNLVTFIVCGLTCWLIFPIFIGVWKWLDTLFTSYELTSQRLRVSRGVLSRRTDDMELYRVKDTTFVQPFTLRLFGLANVVVSSSDISTPWMALEGVAEAEPVRELIREHVERMRDRKGVREIELA